MQWETPVLTRVSIQQADEHNSEERAYRFLRAALQDGSLAPGQKLSVLALSKRIGVSRTPVTQATRRLESEGLLEQIPNRGSFVRRPSAAEVEELFDLRIALESHAVVRAVDRITPKQLDALEQLCDRFDAATEVGSRAGATVDGEWAAGCVEADFTFHLVILHVAGNARLIKTVSDFHMMTRPFSIRPTAGLSSMLQSCRVTSREHRAILAAIRSRDPEQARKEVVQHLSNGMNAVLRTYDQIEKKIRPVEAHVWPASVTEFLSRLDAEGSAIVDGTAQSPRKKRRGTKKR